MSNMHSDNNNANDILIEAMRSIGKGNLSERVGTWPQEPYDQLFREFDAMAASLEETDSLSESFLVTAAHELKTPLSYIQGYSTLLQDTELDDEERSKYLKGIITATKHASLLIGSLLQTFALEQSASLEETHRFSLDEQLRHVMAIFIPHIQGKGLRYDIDLDVADIDGDESLLETVWTNLIGNAVKYTPAGGTISVELVKHDNRAVITVSDTGEGLDEDQLEHAFDRFFRGNNDNKPDGFGLGLPITKTIVLKHQGTIDIASKPNCGTVLTVCLPLAQKA